MKKRNWFEYVKVMFQFFGTSIALGIHKYQTTRLTMGTILLIVLVLILLGVIPVYPHSRSWGYAPSGLIGLILIIFIILLLLNIIPWGFSNGPIVIR